MICRQAWLMGSVNGMPLVCFQEQDEHTESISTGCFTDEHQALLEISLFENKEIWQRLAKEVKDGN